MDATLLNGLANHPDVRPWITQSGQALELDRVLPDPRHVGLVNERGGFIAVWCDPGLYECHTLYRPEDREEAADIARYGLRYLFTHTDCIEATTSVAKPNTYAAQLASEVGFVQNFERPNGWVLDDGGQCAMLHFALSVSRWVSSDPTLNDFGRAFRSRLAELASQAGAPVPRAFSDEEPFNRALGACGLMIRAGNPIKGVGIYNRIAALCCGYPAIKLMNVNPIVVRTGDVVFSMRDQALEVLQCRAIQ